MTIFGETEFGIILMSSLFVLFWTFRRHTNLKKATALNSETTTFLFFFVAWLLVNCLSLLVSVSLAPTINKLAFQVFSFIFFFFFVSVDKEWLSWKMIKVGLIQVGITLAALEVAAWLILPLREHIPTMNLIFANYGHSHISSYALFCIPLCLEIWESSKQRFLKNILVLLFLAILMTSFSRSAQVIGVIEILILAWKRWHVYTPNMKRVASVFFILSCIGIGLVVGVSGYVSFSKAACPFPQLKTQLCKSVYEEQRSIYWRQAINGIEARPILGWGGGNFTAVSFAYKNWFGEFTAYAHNEYLQVFAEFGVVGGSIFVCFIGLVLLSSLKTIFKKERADDGKNSKVFLAVSVLSLILVNFLDFDWEFTSLWLTFLLGVAYLFSDLSGKGIKASFFQKINKILGGCYMIFIGLYILSSIFWNLKQYDTSIKLFPLVYGRVFDVIATSKISSQTGHYIQFFYAHDPNILNVMLTKPLSISEQEKIYLQLYSLNKDQYLAPLLKLYYQDQKWDLYSKYLLGSSITNKTLYIQDDLTVLGQETVRVADQEVRMKNYEQAAALYQKAYELHSAAYSEVDSLLLQNPGVFPTEFSPRFIDQWNPQFVGTHWEALKAWYLMRLENAVLRGDQAEITLSEKRALQFDSDAIYRICEIDPSEKSCPR